MIALILLAVVVLLIVAVIGLASWGATTAATGLTLALTNAVMQTTIALLACALVAGLPVIVFAAFRLDAWRAEQDAERKRTSRVIAITRRAQDADPMLGAGSPTVFLPAPRDETETTTRAYPILTRRARRASPRTRQAAGIARRWFR
ncbi:MAG: hypothetical protein FJ009_05120 [Chloroflexi bacterium]|nr:hypothetical protein [Chloroflexota bacterium]